MCCVHLLIILLLEIYIFIPYRKGTCYPTQNKPKLQILFLAGLLVLKQSVSLSLLPCSLLINISCHCRPTSLECKSCYMILLDRKCTRKCDTQISTKLCASISTDIFPAPRLEKNSTQEGAVIFKEHQLWGFWDMCIPV